MFRISALYLSFAFLVLLGLAPAEEYHETVSVEAVSFYLTAMDSSHHFVTNLKREDFKVTENNIEQSIDGFLNFADEKTSQKVPLTLLFLLDGSTSMYSSYFGVTRMDLLKQGMQQFLEGIDKIDRMKVAGFNELTWDVVPMTNDLDLLKSGVHAMEVKPGKTALYEALNGALDEMKEFSGRKVLVLCSDGMDTASKLSFDSLIEKVKASDDVTILAFATAPISQTFNSRRNVLEILAHYSGGYAVFPENEGEIGKLLDLVRAEMRSQYLISYKPRRSEQKKLWRKIEVVCKSRDVKLRYRPGYYIE